MLPREDQRRVCVRAAQVNMESRYQEVRRTIAMLEALRARQAAGDPVATLDLYQKLGEAGAALRDLARELSVHEVYAERVGDVEGARPG